MTSRSDELFESAKKRIPGGVNSPVRAFLNLGITPPFIASGKGSHLHDVDGREYIDYVGSWGPLVFGHAHPRVLDAVQQALAKGTSFGAPTELEVRIAERICDMVPSVEMVRMVNSGTEAAMSAVRLARGVTGRDGIIKFAGCYHGHGDSFLIKAGSGALTIGVPDSPGVPERSRQGHAGSALQRPGLGCGIVRRTSRSHRGGYRGAGRREYGRGPSLFGVPCRPATHLRSLPIAFDLR